MGWLHATPEKSKKRRFESLDDGDPFKKLPDITNGEYIAELWQDAGLCKSGGMGATALDWSDLASFKVFTDIDYFESKVIIKMSRSYTSWLSNDSKLPPITETMDSEEVRQLNRDRVASQWKAIKANRVKK